MKRALLTPGLFCFAAVTFAFPDDAKARGCIKGAIVGGIAGHFVGHGGLGAAPDVPMECTGGRSTIAKTMAALATNSVVETESAAAIAEIRRGEKSSIC